MLWIKFIWKRLLEKNAKVFLVQLSGVKMGKMWKSVFVYGAGKAFSRSVCVHVCHVDTKAQIHEKFLSNIICRTVLYVFSPMSWKCKKRKKDYIYIGKGKISLGGCVSKFFARNKKGSLY